MTAVIFRGEFRCACGATKKTVVFGRVKSLDDLLPLGWSLRGDAVFCLSCQQSARALSSPSDRASDGAPSVTT